MKVIFVGIHNKLNTMPLCSSTKSGKLIDRVIEAVPCECLKTNLFDLDHYPDSDEKERLAKEWYNRIEYDLLNDIVVLLGASVHKMFIDAGFQKLLKVAHPSSMWSHEKMDEYVEKIVNKINRLL